MVITVQDFNLFIRKLLSEKPDYFDELIIPSNSVYDNKENLFFSKLQNEKQSFDIGDYRTVDPVKILFYTPREKVLPDYFERRRRLLIGVKACDINALLFLDKALLNSGFSDPAYNHWRKNTVIISSDCLSLHPKCSCSFVGGKPYPLTGYDLNLSKIEDNYNIEIGSVHGEELLQLMKSYIPVRESTPDLINEIEARRRQLFEKLEQSVEAKLCTYSELRNIDDNALWMEDSKNCVGCGSCTNICPACYCLILNDESVTDQFIKVRSYDSCQLYGYARVAGGGTPRKKIYQRFRNRLMCKFSYTKSNFNMIGCTGCGRCLETCASNNAFLSMAKLIQEKETEQIHST